MDVENDCDQDHQRLEEEREFNRREDTSGRTNTGTDGASASTSRKKRTSTNAEDALVAALNANPIPGWDLTREYRFHPERRWRFDVAFPSLKVAIEVDGQRHRTFGGIRSDCEELNAAALLGWRVLRFPSDQKRHAHEWAEFVREVLLLAP